jgi:hypothetical protein
MTTRDLMMAACALLLQASLALADGAPSSRPVNAFGRDTLCLAGTVETANGCVPVQAQDAADLKSVHMRACMADTPTLPQERSLAGSRARYAYCLYMFTQKTTVAKN